MAHYITTLVCALISVTFIHAHHHKLKATCEVSADSGVDSQNVTGTIRLKQKKNGGEVKIKINLSGFDTSDGVSVHGFHIHQNGDLGNQCSDAGGHYNPDNVTHAARNNSTRHVGDLGNIEEDDEGRVKTKVRDDVISLRSEDNERYVVGRAIVIHANEDDLGLGGNAGSLATGNAGGRLACCVITMETAASTETESTESDSSDSESTESESTESESTESDSTEEDE